MDKSLLNYVIVATYLTVLPLYIWLAYKTRGRSQLRRAQRRFYQGVLAVIDNSSAPDEYTAQIGMLYRRLSEKQPYLARSFRSPIELIEELIVKVDTLSEAEFKELYQTDKPSEYRAKLISCLVELKRVNPFSLISSKEASLLQTVLGTLESGNKELGERSIMQLAEELEVLESKLRTEEKKNTTSFIVTVVSAILTVFFGVISLVPLLQQKPQQPNISVERDAPQAALPPASHPSP